MRCCMILNGDSVMKKLCLMLALAGLSVSAVANTPAKAKANSTLTVEMALLDVAKGNQAIGQVTISQSPYGLVFTPNLKGLTVGIHGFHIHENPSCEPKEKDGKLTAALGAGGHWNPKNAKQHGFPWQKDAHLGDLPALYVSADGTATYPVLAPRLKSLKQIRNRALMVHVGGDNHADHPAPLGGGGARMACGVIR